ncbi:ABC transporter substrate-binding protein [Arthrobacter agilis]|uniref:ABC transporter substrate-binding protein n=1 Tax=Arthrobacter agilis TaxID=37921 RepID=UPI002365CDDA|nr:ABC transporter substrate-binding protein [Arthrobacter agilis]WDF34078.1 ABC transporter substrate-binding protein [Arthrobacter agilis]
MKNVRRGVCAVAAAAVMGLTACGGGTDVEAADLTATPEYEGTLSILTKFGGEPLSPYFEDLAAEYTSMHPDVDFEIIQETDQSVKDKTKTLVASSALPDIYFSWTGDYADKFIEGGLATDLSAVLSPDSEWGSTFGQASLDAFAEEGKYYAVPLYNNGKFMGYNKSIFDEAGVAVPTTFEELIAACPKLEAQGVEPLAFGNKDGWPGLHVLQQLFAYNVPQDVLEKDFVPATAGWDHPGYVKSLEEFQTLVQECTGTGSDSNGVLYSTAQQAQSAGRAAMYFQEILEFDSVVTDSSEITAEDFGIFALPAPEGAEGDAAALEGSPEGMMVNARSPRQALAVDFLKFATSKANAATLAGAPFSQPSTIVGAVSGSTASPAVVEGVSKLNDASYLLGWLDAVTVPEVADAWLAGGEALVSGSETPEEVLSSVRAASDSAE